MRTPPALRLLPALLLAAACATGSGGAERQVAEDQRTATQVVTAEEIAAVGAGNAWEALRATVKFVVWRETVAGSPQMATRRGNTSMLGPEDVRVVIDGSVLLDLRDLRLMPARDIREIRVLNPLEATTYFGTNSGAGAILIFTR